MRRAIFLLLLSGGVAWAEESDYRPENEGWNGLSELFTIARTAGVRPEMRAELPWDELGPDDGIAIIYPRVSVDVGRLRDYLARGGRALVADDFGAAASVFESFGLARGQPPAQTPRYQDLSGREMPELPIAQAENHPLTQGVQRVVANHPAALHGQVGRPILTFGAGESLCVEIEVGRGRLYALSDPSVLINNMLELSENHAFAYNLVGGLARPGGRLIVVTQEFAERGVPKLAGGGSGGESGFAGTTNALGDFNHFLKDLSAWQPSDSLLRFLGFLAALFGAALLGWRLRSQHAPGTKWVRPFLPEAHAAAEAALPALLREEIDERLEQAHKADDDARVRALSRLARKAAGHLTAARGRRLAARMERIG
jgi:hypothetical protein